MTEDSCDYNLTAEEKLIKARIKLQREKPFFSYLIMNLNYVEEKEVETMGVDGYGNCYFNPAFVNTLTPEEIKAVLCHEVLHCAFEHFDRKKDRLQTIFNISGDIVINDIITEQGMTLPKNTLTPVNHQITAFGIKIQNTNNKTAEEVYDDLWRVLSKDYNRVMKAIEDFVNSHKDSKKGFDKHIYKDGKGKDGKKKGEGAGNVIDIPKDWKNILIDACTFARQRGNLPAGMERIVGKLLETYIDWRGLLYRYITSQIPVDYTWARPSKKSYSLGYYLPAVERELIEIKCAVDTSGSIGQDELAEFISEISGIVKSFKNVNLTVIDCDAEVNGVHELKHASVGEIIEKVGKKLKGGGGTSHVPVFDWINKNAPNTKFVICFTDGCTLFPPKSEVKQPVLWVLGGSWRTDKDKIPYGEVIELPKRNR
jgi:predicted metal-dependent peptidase